MTGDLLSQVTTVTDYLGLTVSLWLALYLLARGFGNPVTLRVVIALLAVTLYSFNAFSSTLDPASGNEALREFAVALALVAWHHLTHYLLPSALQRKVRWVTYLVFLFGLVSVAILLATHGGSGRDPRLIYEIPFNSPMLIVGALQIAICVAIFYNVLLKARTATWPQNLPFYLALALGTGTSVYSLVGTLLQIPLPRFIATSLVLAGFIFLGYSVARYQVLIDRRISLRDLPASAITIFGLTAVYVLVTWKIGLPTIDIALVSILAISTHSIYDLVQQLMDGVFHRQERQLWSEIRRLSRDVGSQDSLKASLRRGLAILCQNLQASDGFIALLNDNGAEVVASLHTIPTEFLLRKDEVVVDTITQPVGVLSKTIAWLAPAFGGGRQLAVIGIGPRLGNKEYTEADLFWLEDFADQVGAMVFAQNKPAARSSAGSHAEAEEMLNALAYKPDAHLIEIVEDALRNLNDYIKLGQSPLVNMLKADGKTNIERGKAVQQKLVHTLESLRPAGNPPGEPLPREWHSYVILHDAYVDDVPDRDIMGKLYVSEGTFYRARRKALHGVSKALMEMGAVI